MSPKNRKTLWNTHRLFYCTPQTLQNDLKRGMVHIDRLTCVVVDEAHKAKGNYAYTKVLQVVFPFAQISSPAPPPFGAHTQTQFCGRACACVCFVCVDDLFKE